MADSTVTVAMIRQLDIAGIGEDATDDSIQALIDSARLIALADKFPKTATRDGEVIPVLDMATKAMSMHLLNTSDGGGAGITSEKIDVLETHYADTSRLKWLRRTPWGQLYARLLHDFVGGQTHFKVIQH